MLRVSNKGKGTTMHNNNKGKGQICISMTVHKVVQFLRRASVDLVLKKIVRFGHLGLEPADIVFDPQLLQLVLNPFLPGAKKNRQIFEKIVLPRLPPPPTQPRQKLIYHCCMDTNMLTLLQTCVILPACTTMSSEHLPMGIGCDLEDEVSLPSSSEEDEGSVRHHGCIHCFHRHCSHCCRYCHCWCCS